MRVIGVGRLTKDPEIRVTTSGKKVATFSLACRRTADVTDYPSCVAWEKTAELLEKYTRKGSQIEVDGRLTTRSYDDPNYPNRKVYVTEVLVDSIVLCGDRPKEDEEEKTKQSNGSLDFDVDNLPF